MSTFPYVIICPVRNEEDFLDFTIESVRSQTLRPTIMVIVNDGSTDGTGQVAKKAAAQSDWIRIVDRADRGYRKPGGGVIDAFYDGFTEIGVAEWEFVIKLDGDLSFSPDYFERCFARFEKDPKLGIGGGTVCKEVSGQLIPESTVDPAFHVRGATKIYRKRCWEQIGGLIRAPGWDTVDEVKANMLGWVTYSFPDIRIHHHRPAGQAQGVWKDWFKNGLANYTAGYHPLFMFFKCIRRFICKPYAISSIGLMAGFLSGYIKRVPQVEDEEFIRYFQEQQIRRLTLRSSLWTIRSN
ncbi:MAG: glycosyltransferase family A protein [Verrucomicrobiota bacterium]